MATAVNMVINDGQVTPVAVTFTPVFRDANGVYWFHDLVETNPLLRRMISISLKNPSRGQKEPMYKANVRVFIPTPDITSPTTGTGIQPAPSKAYTTVSDMTFMIPQRSTLANRRDAEAFSRNLLSNTLVQGVLRDLNMVT